MAFFLAVWGGAGAVGAAQFRVDRPVDAEDASAAEDALVFLPPDRITLQRLNQARQLVEEDRFSEAVRRLDEILQGPEDFFFRPEGSGPLHRSLKGEAERLIGALPPAGRGAYELRFGDEARRLLETAASAGDAEGLAEVSRRYFHTAAGYEATFLLAAYHFNHDRPLAAALAAQRLQRAGEAAAPFEPTLSVLAAAAWLRTGMEENARNVLGDLERRVPGATVDIAGRPTPLFAGEGDPLDRLGRRVASRQEPLHGGPHEWRMFLGNPSRNAPSRGGTPLLNLRWRVAAADHPVVEQMIDVRRRSAREYGRLVLPAMHPLVVDDVVLMRTIRTLLAVDFHTGKRLWEIPVESPFQDVVEGGDIDFHQAYLALGLEQRLWEDATYGTLSSDGRLVFSVEDLEVDFSPHRAPVIIMGGRRQFAAARNDNRLAAHDIRTGKLVWHLGGGPEEYGLPLAESFFLGPPLPLARELFVLAEEKGEIRLLALNASSGEVLWSQQLALAEQPVLHEPVRRLAGASPSYADGILVCPTVAGAVVAVDLATRALLWGYTYPRDASYNAQARLAAVRLGYPRTVDDADRWRDATATIAEGRVLLTPPDSTQLHCIDLVDGRPLWQVPQEGDLFVAAVHGGMVVLMGSRGLRALHLADGSPAWDDRLEFPDQARPSGRGFLAAGRYYLPLDSAEVVAIDLAAGELVGSSRSRDGTVLGNLVCYGDKVLAQGPQGLDAYYALNALRAEVESSLEETPDDPRLLVLMSEILLDAEDYAGAAELLRRALGADDDPRIVEQLFEALVEGLEHDFPAFEPTAAEARELAVDAGQRGRLLRTLAEGYHAAGRWEDAWREYLHLVDFDRDHPGLEQLTRTRLVRRDRWIRARIGALRSAAPPEVVAAMDEDLASRLAAAEAASGSGGLESFVAHFDGHPSAERAQWLLAERFAKAGRWLPAEQVLLRLERAGPPEQQARAAARLALLHREAGRPDASAVYYRRLADAFAEVECLDDQTGRQLVEALPGDDAVHAYLAAGPVWPQGLVHTRIEQRRAVGRAAFGRLPLETADGGPFFAHAAFSFDQARQLLVARDGLGRPLWQVPLPDVEIRYAYGRGLNKVHARGHLITVSLGTQMLAVDAGVPESPRVLWHHDLSAPIPASGAEPAALAPGGNAGGAQPIFQGGRGMIVAPAALEQVHLSRLYSQTGGSLALVTDRLVCYQQLRTAVAVEPLTGKVLWTRSDLPLGSSILGDEEFVLVVDSQGDEATILSTLDGERLGTRSMPDQRDTVAIIGRDALVRSLDGGRTIVERLDLASGEVHWSAGPFGPAVHSALLGEEALGLYDPAGHFRLVDLSDGETLFTSDEVPEVRQLMGIRILPRGENLVLLANLRPGPNRTVQTQPLQGFNSEMVALGKVILLDRDGGLVAPAVDVEDQHLPHDQPAELPLLVFACTVFERSPGGTSQQRQLSVLAIDTRNGRALCRERIPGIANSFEIFAEPEQSAVRLFLDQWAFHFELSDDPLPPPATPGEATAPRPQRSPLSVFRNALERAAQNAMDRALPGAPEHPRQEALVPIPDDLFDALPPRPRR